MTIEAITGLTIVSVSVVVMAVIDPSITSIALAVIAAMVVIIPLWFKFKTDALNMRLKEHDSKIEQVIKTSDGIKDALVKATAKASFAEGVNIGIDKAESKAAIVAEAKSEGKLEAINKEKI